MEPVPERSDLRGRRALGGLLSGLLVALLLLTAVPARAGTVLFDVDVDDRVDPVRPGDELVYEIEIENSRPEPAPDVVVTDFLPPGTTFVAAYREPDWAEVPAEVLPGEVRLHLGDEPGCGQVGLPPCNTIWATVRVDDGVAPGTVLANRVEMSSSDPLAFPTHRSVVYTSVGSAAIRKAWIVFPGQPGRDRITVDVDLARAGLRTPLHPRTPTIDLADGIRVKLGEPGAAPVVDVTVPGSAFVCSGTGSRSCRLADPAAFRPLGLHTLVVFLPAKLLQRNNARLRAHTAALSLADDFGPVLEVRVESGGVEYVDIAQMRPGRDRLSYTHKQTKP